MPANSSFPENRVSLEFFPPKSIPAERALMTAAHALRRFAPAYQTVTFGAGGSDVSDNLDWPARLQGLNDVPTAAHVSLSRFASRADLLAHVDELWEQGVSRLVLIRGDGVGDSGNDLTGFASVSDAVAVLKAHRNFDIAVSAYPETHPLAQSADSDMDVLLAKQKAGADRAITQYFFNNEDFYAFRDRAERAGFYREIVPGIMPISNFDKIAKFSKACGATIPAALAEKFAACGDDREAHTNLARAYVAQQVEDLARNGVDAIHIYTLNRVDLTADAIRAFQAEHDRLSPTRELRLVG